MAFNATLAASPSVGYAARIGAMLLTGSFAVAHVPVYAAGALPIPCPGAGSVCVGGTGKSLGFDQLGTGSTLARNAAGTNLTINQVGNSAIFNWASFNISPGNTVQFVEPSSSSVALNRIFDPNATSIAGNLLANGQVYLINPNGILFGSGANVNVAGLIASTSNLADIAVTSGLLATNVNPGVLQPIFSNSASVLGASAADTPIASAGASPSIVVQQGATLYAAGRDSSGTVVSAGRVFLFAPAVENAGNITVDGGGQVILAAGSNIYLGSSSDPSLRGLLVEVTGNQSAVTIDPAGSITVAHGNITLMGLAINQAGTLTATSALDENGSIRLVAREANGTTSTGGAPVAPDGLLPVAETGTVNIESGSKTIVSLDTSDTATAPVDDPTASSLTSTIDIEGGAVNIGVNNPALPTLIQAHGGSVTVSARTPGGGAYFDGNSVLGASDLNSPTGQGNIDVGPNTTIDVSGLQNVPINPAQDFVYTELTSLNLADAPYQRTGLLLDQYVYLNLLAVPSWINVSSLQQAIPENQAQRNTVGGTIALNAEGTVTLAKGSVLNVSGGSEYVIPTVGRTTQLLTADGQVVDISNASETTDYVAFADGGSYTEYDPREGVDTIVYWQTPALTQIGGYLQGQNAGRVQIYASAANLNGTLLGQTTVGPAQRSAPPAGGTLRIGSQSSDLDADAGISRPNILLAGTAQQLAQGLASDLQAITSGPTIELNASELLGEGFTNLSLTSDGVIELASGSPLNLGPRGSFSASANALAIDSSIAAPGGSVSLVQRPLTALVGNDNSTPDEITQRNSVSLIAPGAALFGSVVLGSGVKISTAGLWTNDKLLGANVVPTSPLVLNGGDISIYGSYIDVSGASFDVSSGAWLAQNGSYSGGSAGALSITALPSAPALVAAPTAPQLDLGSDFAGRIAGYGQIGGGGTLSLGAWSLELGSATAIYLPTGAQDPAAVAVNPAVGGTGFQTFSFSAYEIAGLSADTQFVPQVRFLQSANSLALTPSGPSLLAVGAAPVAALPGTAVPTSITLQATATESPANPLGGLVQVGTGALVDAGVEGSIKLSGFGAVYDNGTLRARAGSVTLTLGNGDITNGDFTLPVLESRSVQLGANALIDVSGVSLATTQSNGLVTGRVLDAGSVSLDAPYGTVAVDPGAQILANGASAPVDVLGQGGQYALQTVTSAGGQVNVNANAGIFLDGQIQAAGAGSSNGGSLSVALGAISVTAASGGNAVDSNVAAFLSTPTNLNVTSSLPGVDTNQATFAPLLAGSGSSAVGGPVAYVSPATINNSGFEQVWLQSADTITLGQTMALGARTGTGAPYVLNSLVLSAQAIDAAPLTQVRLTGAYVALGPLAQLSDVNGAGYSNFESALPAGSSGSASLLVQGEQIDLVGNLALQGIAEASLSSSGDVRTLGVQEASDPSRYAGTLSFGGNVVIDAAQLYPATQTDYTFTFAPTGTAADANHGQLLVTANGTRALAPLSAGGTLTFNVNSFVDAGRIDAPQGSITVNAPTIVLEPGSLLSVAGSGLVPFGEVYNGTEWSYGVPALGNASPTLYDIASSSGTSLAVKGISLNAGPAGTLSAQPGSTIDIAGGGDVLGTGFVAGPGGSYDMSINFPYGNNTPNPLFALIPSRGTAAAPYDPQVYSNISLDSGLPSSGVLASTNLPFAMGETITIGPGSAIPAGTYAILPARYALLPGAFAVEAVSGYAGITPSAPQPLPDGTVVVAGKLGFDAAGTQATLWSAFRVYTNSQFNTLSQFEEYYGTQFFDAAAAEAGQVAQRVGNDAGTLQIEGNAIQLGSTIDSAPAPGGRGAEFAIDAPAIVVGSFPTAQSAPSTTLDLDAGTLTALDAQTLILGATDTGSGATVALSNPVAAQSISVQASTAPLAAGQVLLAASNVSVSTGATIAAVPSQAPPTTAVTLSGDGAALYVGNVIAPPAWTRSNASAPGSATTGNLSLASGALVQGTTALFDASDAQTYGSGLILQVASLDLSSSTINIGAVPAGTSGLNLTPALLSILSAVHNLYLTGIGGVDVYGTATLGQLSVGGAPSIDSLTLVAPGISGFGAASDSLTISAGHVTLDNSAGAIVASTGTGSGSLAIKSAATTSDDGSIDVAGQVSLTGFSSVSLDATGRAASSTQTAAGTGDLTFTGSVGSTPGIVVSGTQAALAIDATRITAQSGVDASISVPGALTISASGPAAAPQQAELGAALAITAQSVAMGGRIDLPAGVVSISATGAGAGDGITLQDGASIRVAGLTQEFATTSADVSAGSISLATVNGSVVQQSGATLDIGGAGTEGSAGNLSLAAANGTVTLGGTVLAAPGSSANGANFAVDAGSIASLPALLQTLGAAAGPAGAGSIDVRARDGNLDVAAGETIKAGSITLEADGGGGAGDGSINLAGTLDASGSNGGTISLYANDQVVLQTGALLNASATSASGNGGSVLISSRIVADPAATLDAVVLQQGSTINVGAGTSGVGGTVLLRAPQVTVNGSQDVAITAASGATVTGTLNDLPNGINEEIVEAVRVYSAADNAIIAANPNVNLDPTMPGGDLLSEVQSDAQNYMAAAASAVGTRLAALGSFSLRPGIEIDTTGTITVSSSSASVLDFAATNGSGAFLWRYGAGASAGNLATSTPGALILRAGGGINVDESISDGFATTTPGAALNSTVATQGDSWSYTLTAGADLSAADANRAAAGTEANLVVGSESSINPVAIRTGTGSIALNASGDVVLDNGVNQQGNVVYTAGVEDFSDNAALAAYLATAPAISVSVTQARQGTSVITTPVALTQYGGSLSIDAGGSVTGTAEDGSNVDGSTQNINEWLLREGNGTALAPTVWFVDFAQFEQGFGALGGGSLTISAGVDVARVGAVVPSMGFNGGSGTIEVNNGALAVTAGGNVEQGLYYDESGAFNLRATSFVSNSASPTFGSIRLAQGSNDLVLQARESAEFDPSFNPTATSPSVFNVGNAKSKSPPTWQTEFLTFTSATTLDARAAAGDILLDSFSAANGSTTLTTKSGSDWSLTAPNVQMVAFAASISSPGDTAFTMAPSATGQLRLLAGGSIFNLSVQMSQSDPALLPSPAAPVLNEDLTNTVLKVNYVGSGGAALHADDPLVAQVVALDGSIAGVDLFLPKTADVVAGNTIGGADGSAVPFGNGATVDVATVVEIQNDNANSLSTVSAGQDITFANAVSNEGVTIDGPGAAQIVSGGPMNLGANGSGIVSQGNFANANLSPVGASLIVVAGAGRTANGLAALPDYAGAITNFVQYDAFASMGSAAPALNEQVIAALSADAALAPLVAALQAGLADRSSAANSASTFNRLLAQLTPAQLAVGAARLAAAIQVVNNAVFVESNNSDTFAPAYMAFGDLFPNLYDDTQALKQFVLNNVFAKAGNGSALQQRALQGLPAALLEVIDLGLQDPASVNQADSPFARALAALDSTTLQAGMRQLMANVLQVAGQSEESLAASGQLTGTGSPYAKQLTALAQAFSPATPAGLNDLQMDYNELKVEQTGDLAFFDPQGAVIVGQQTPPTFATPKDPSQLGIFTYGGGDIIGMTRDSVDVYQSRVFTVAGGDIDMWSSLQNIDAGRGSRDVQVVPPPTLVVESNGTEALDLSSTVSGSGIGALVTEADQPPSDINLMAPAGYVDAGEAGIRSQSGKVLLGTNLVLNAGNIQAASGVSGGTVVATPPPPLPPSTGSTAADRMVAEAEHEAMAQQQAAAASLSQRPMHIVGEFIGFDTCAAAGGSDEECADSDSGGGSDRKSGGSGGAANRKGGAQ